MPISKGTAKQVAYKKETTFGTLAGNTSGKLLRRVTANFNLAKEAYESNEIRVDRQVADFRHGVRSAEGTLNGELSSASYSDFMGSVVGKDFAAVTLGAAAQVTVTVVGTTYTLVRATGSWLTDGLKVGMVVRASGLTTSGDNSKNLLVASLTATNAVVVPLNGSTMTAQGTASSVTLTAPGKQTFVPTTGHTDDSYTVEEFYSDIAQSEVYTGMKVNSVAVQLPATGLTTVDIGFAGKDLTQTGTTQYFTSPTAQGTTGIFAAVNGVLLVNGAPVALVTSADFTIERATENATVVGSNSIADIFTGRIRVTGNMSVYFQDAAFRDYFNAESTVSLVLTVTSDSTATANFVAFAIPKVKLGTFTKDDGELGLISSSSFQALLNDVTTAGLPATTIQIQDSAA
jgi:Phage tail tube protein